METNSQLFSRLPAFPFLRRQRLDVELVTRPRIGVPTHAADGIHQLLVDMQVRRVDRIAAHVDAEHLTQNDLAGRTNLKGRVAAAFQSRGRCQNAGAAHHLAGNGRKTCFLHLVHLGGRT